MWVKIPEIFPEILKSGYPLDFFGLFIQQTVYDHRAEIKFQRISAKNAEIFGFFNHIRYASDSLSVFLRLFISIPLII